MSKLSDIVPIPPLETFNLGLHSASESTMIKLLGIPGRKTEDCSDPTGDFAEHVTGLVDVGPFRVRGLNAAVESIGVSTSRSADSLAFSRFSTGLAGSGVGDSPELSIACTSRSRKRRSPGWSSAGCTSASPAGRKSPELDAGDWLAILTLWMWWRVSASS